MIARIGGVILLVAVILVAVNRASAHPLGNFSINQYSAVRVGQGSIALRYIVDMAEIPTFQELQESSIAAVADDPDTRAYLAKKVAKLREGLLLEINGRRLSLRAESKEIIFPPGAGGLPTLKIGVLYKANFSADGDSPRYVLKYSDGNFSGRAGWKEIVVVSRSAVRLVNSSVPQTDRSAELTNYPTDLLNSPPQQLDARAEFALMEAMGPVASGKATGIDSGLLNPAFVTVAGYSSGEGTHPQLDRQGTPRDSFTELVASPELDWSIVLIALFVAAALGAFHALEPGHGKTLVAAYLVGSRGTMRHALLLGLIVTAAHTAGVYLLGGVTIYASQYVVPERLYPWLGVLSGMMITALGAFLVIQRYRSKGVMHQHHHHGQQRRFHHHDHGHTHDHGHFHAYEPQHEHNHKHAEPVHRHQYERTSVRELLTLGISGGIVPCPAALVVLLSAAAMNRVGFGLLLIVAFSAGLAAVLIAIGILMVNARRYMSRFQGEGKWVTRWLPMASSAFIVAIGVGLTWQAWRGAGLPLLAWI